MYEMTMHTSYGDTIANPYDVDQHNPPHSREKMIVALDEAHNSNMIELHRSRLDDLKTAIETGNVKVIMQRLNGMIGYEVRLQNACGKTFTGHLHRNRRQSQFASSGNRRNESGLTVVNRKGKEWRFDYKEITNVTWNDLENGYHRMRITYNG